MSEQAVGIDVSKQKLDVCALSNGKKKNKVFRNTQAGHQALLSWLEARQLAAGTFICLEATGPYSEAVATALADGGWPVSIVNPARVKGYAQSQLSRNKTDKSDASLLASFACSADLERWQPPSLEQRELRALVERLQALLDMRQQEANRLEALSHGSPTSVEGMVRDHLAWLDNQIAEIEKDIDDHIDGNPQLKQDVSLIESIPGIGRKTGARILAYLGDVRRFRDAKALAAFIGVTPRQKQSGSSVKGRTMMCRTGHAGARKALYMPGLVAIRHNPVIAAMADRLKGKGLAPKAIVGASMRKLAHLIYGVVTSNQRFNAQIPMRGLVIQDGI